MNSSSEEELDFTPPNTAEEAKILSENLLPPKSREKYEKTYEEFIKWKTGKKATSFSENILLSYFNDLSKNKRPSTLWCEYSKLKTTIRLKQNVNIGDYANLITFLKRKSDGFMPKKSKVLSGNNIGTFLKEAPDDQYLLEKVVLIFGVNGACRSNEMTTLTINDVETHNNRMIVQLCCTKTKNDRMFIVQGEQLKVVQKYQMLRPVDIISDRFFINFKNGKCTKQVVGRHTIAAIPKRIATYLNLPDIQSYTGHCLRRSSATLVADTGANLITLKRHGGWLSDKVAEGYIKESVENKSKITTQINEAKVNTTLLPGRPSTSKTKGRRSSQTVARKTAFQSSSGDDDDSVVDRNEDTDSATDSEELPLYPNLVKKPAEPSTAATTGSEYLQQPDKDGGRHDVASCNSCSGDIIGFRYTCVQCSDYNQCGSCEARGAHCAHYVLRIPARRPCAEIQSVLSKIRTQLLCREDSLPELDTPLGAPADVKEEDAIKIEIKEELPDDPLETDSDAFQPVDNSDEIETKYTTPETTQPTLPQIPPNTTVTEIFDKTLVIIENPVSASSAASHAAAAADGTKRRLAHRSTQPPHLSEKRGRPTPQAQGSNLFIEVPVSKKLVYSVPERMLENIILYPQDTSAADSGCKVRGRAESSFQVYSQDGVKEPDVKPGPSTDMASTSSLSRSRKSDTINK